MANQEYDSRNPFFWIEANHICAICTKDLTKCDSKTSLHNPINNSTDIRASQVLESISEFKLQPHGPNYVCAVCFKNIASTYKFQQICNKAQQLFNSFTQYHHGQTTDVFTPDVQFETPNNTLNDVVTTLKRECKYSAENSDQKYVSSKRKVGFFKCTYCDAVFDYQTSFQSHINRHEQRYVCSYCGKAMGNRNGLVLHERIHTGERPYPCGHCSKAFRTKEGWEHHAVTHTKEMPFNCDICLKRFNRKSILRTHLRIHVGDKPHKCPECNKAFTQSGTLKKHLQTHQKERQRVRHKTITTIALKEVTEDNDNDDKDNEGSEGSEEEND